LLTEKSPEGNIAYMLLDLEGHIDPGVFREALARTLARHPTMMGTLRVSFPLGRPYWKIPADVDAEARRAATTAHQFEDFRSVPDWQNRIAKLYPSGECFRWNHRAGPQVRFEQYALPDGRTRLFFRWPHFLMDADGAQWFLAQLGRQRPEDMALGTPGFSDLPRPVAPDEQRIDVLKGLSFFSRIRMVRRGLSAQQNHGTLRIQQLVKTPAEPYAEHRVLYRHWNSEQTRQLQELAKRTTPAGPALYARYLGSCVIRALHMIFQENGVESEAYLVTMPVRVGMSQYDAGLFERRPVPGNYLVTPVLCGRRDLVDDRRALGEDLLRQFQEYLRNKVDLTQWAMMWAASTIHAWIYRMIFKLPLDIVEFGSGFSYYGEISEPIRSLCGARVLNAWGGGPTTTPPALNPVYSKFEDRLNLSLTYDHQVISDELAGRYLELIDQQMFEPAESA